MKNFHHTQDFQGTQRWKLELIYALEFGKVICFTKQKARGFGPKLSPGGTAVYMCVFKPITPVNYSAAEVTDCAVTQLLYTHPSNDAMI